MNPSCLRKRLLGGLASDSQFGVLLGKGEGKLRYRNPFPRTLRYAVVGGDPDICENFEKRMCILGMFVWGRAYMSPLHMSF